MADDDFEPLQKITDLLVSRLERLSVDSYWAHRASGIRGSLLRCKDNFTQVYNSLDLSDAMSARKLELENQLIELMAIGKDVVDDLEAKTMTLRIDAIKLRARKEKLRAELFDILADEILVDD